MNLSTKNLIDILLSFIFIYKRTNGSHHIYYNPISNKTAIVPLHKGIDLKKGTFFGILKQAGVDKKDFK